METYTVTIIYKNGVKVTLPYKKFSTKYTGGTLTSIEWEAAGPDKPLHIGLDDIAAIFQGVV